MGIRTLAVFGIVLTSAILCGPGPVQAQLPAFACDSVQTQNSLRRLIKFPQAPSSIEQIDAIGQGAPIQVSVTFQRIAMLESNEVYRKCEAEMAMHYNGGVFRRVVSYGLHLSDGGRYYLRVTEQRDQ